MQTLVFSAHWLAKDTLDSAFATSAHFEHHG